MPEFYPTSNRRLNRSGNMPGNIIDASGTTEYVREYMESPIKIMTDTDFEKRLDVVRKLAQSTESLLPESLLRDCSVLRDCNSDPRKSGTTSQDFGRGSLEFTRNSGSRNGSALLCSGSGNGSRSGSRNGSALLCSGSGNDHPDADKKGFQISMSQVIADCQNKLIDNSTLDLSHLFSPGNTSCRANEPDMGGVSATASNINAAPGDTGKKKRKGLMDDSILKETREYLRNHKDYTVKKTATGKTLDSVDDVITNAISRMDECIARSNSVSPIKQQLDKQRLDNIRREADLIRSIENMGRLDDMSQSSIQMQSLNNTLNHSFSGRATPYGTRGDHSFIGMNSIIIPSVNSNHGMEKVMPSVNSNGVDKAATLQPPQLQSLQPLQPGCQPQSLHPFGVQSLHSITIPSTDKSSAVADPIEGGVNTTNMTVDMIRAATMDSTMRQPKAPVVDIRSKTTNSVTNSLANGIGDMKPTTTVFVNERGNAEVVVDNGTANKSNIVVSEPILVDPYRGNVKLLVSPPKRVSLQHPDKPISTRIIANSSMKKPMPFKPTSRTAPVSQKPLEKSTPIRGQRVECRQKPVANSSQKPAPPTMHIIYDEAQPKMIERKSDIKRRQQKEALAMVRGEHFESSPDAGAGDVESVIMEDASHHGRGRMVIDDTALRKKSNVNTKVRDYAAGLTNTYQPPQRIVIGESPDKHTYVHFDTVRRDMMPDLLEKPISKRVKTTKKTFKNQKEWNSSTGRLIATTNASGGTSKASVPKKKSVAASRKDSSKGNQNTKTPQLGKNVRASVTTSRSESKDSKNSITKRYRAALGKKKAGKTTQNAVTNSATSATPGPRSATKKKPKDVISSAQDLSDLYVRTANGDMIALKNLDVRSSRDIGNSLNLDSSSLRVSPNLNSSKLSSISDLKSNSKNTSYHEKNKTSHLGRTNTSHSTLHVIPSPRITRSAENIPRGGVLLSSDSDDEIAVVGRDSRREDRGSAQARGDRASGRASTSDDELERMETFLAELKKTRISANPVTVIPYSSFENDRRHVEARRSFDADPVKHSARLQDSSDDESSGVIQNGNILPSSRCDTLDVEKVEQERIERLEREKIERLERERAAERAEKEELRRKSKKLEERYNNLEREILGRREELYLKKCERSPTKDREENLLGKEPAKDRLLNSNSATHSTTVGVSSPSVSVSVGQSQSVRDSLGQSQSVRENRPTAYQKTMSLVQEMRADPVLRQRVRTEDAAGSDEVYSDSDAGLYVSDSDVNDNLPPTAEEIRKLRAKKSKAKKKKSSPSASVDMISNSISNAVSASGTKKKKKKMKRSKSAAAIEKLQRESLRKCDKVSISVNVPNIGTKAMNAGMSITPGVDKSYAGTIQNLSGNPSGKKKSHEDLHPPEVYFSDSADTGLPKVRNLRRESSGTMLTRTTKERRLQDGKESLKESTKVLSKETAMQEEAARRDSRTAVSKKKKGSPFQQSIHSLRSTQHSISHSIRSSPMGSRPGFSPPRETTNRINRAPEQNFLRRTASAGNLGRRCSGTTVKRVPAPAGNVRPSSKKKKSSQSVRDIYVRNAGKPNSVPIPRPRRADTQSDFVTRKWYEEADTYGGNHDFAGPCRDDLTNTKGRNIHPSNGYATAPKALRGEIPVELQNMMRRKDGSKMGEKTRNEESSKPLTSSKISMIVEDFVRSEEVRYARENSSNDFRGGNEGVYSVDGNDKPGHKDIIPDMADDIRVVRDVVVRKRRNDEGPDDSDKNDCKDLYKGTKPRALANRSVSKDSICSMHSRNDSVMSGRERVQSWDRERRERDRENREKERERKEMGRLEKARRIAEKPERSPEYHHAEYNHPRQFTTPVGNESETFSPELEDSHPVNQQHDVEQHDVEQHDVEHRANTESDNSDSSNQMNQKLLKKLRKKYESEPSKVRVIDDIDNIIDTPIMSLEDRKDRLESARRFSARMRNDTAFNDLSNSKRSNPNPVMRDRSVSKERPGSSRSGRRDSGKDSNRGKNSSRVMFNQYNEGLNERDCVMDENLIFEDDLAKSAIASGSKLQLQPMDRTPQTKRTPKNNRTPKSNPRQRSRSNSQSNSRSNSRNSSVRRQKKDDNDYCFITESVRKMIKKRNELSRSGIVDEVESDEENQNRQNVDRVQNPPPEQKPLFMMNNMKPFSENVKPFTGAERLLHSGGVRKNLSSDYSDEEEDLDRVDDNVMSAYKDLLEDKKRLFNKRNGYGKYCRVWSDEKASEREDVENANKETLVNSSGSLDESAEILKWSPVIERSDRRQSEVIKCSLSLIDKSSPMTNRTEPMTDDSARINKLLAESRKLLEDSHPSSPADESDVDDIDLLSQAPNGISPAKSDISLTKLERSMEQILDNTMRLVNNKKKPITTTSGTTDASSQPGHGGGERFVEKEKFNGRKYDTLEDIDKAIEALNRELKES